MWDETRALSGGIYASCVSTSAAIADATFGSGILPFLQWLIPWVGLCLTLTTVRIVWQIKSPKPVVREWKWSMIATGLGLGFIASALAVHFLPNMEGLQVGIVGTVALFPDRFLRILMNLFDQLEADPFGFVRRLRRGDPES